jgi:alpha-beta hydrolase superfamily lysophospholipase
VDEASSYPATESQPANESQPAEESQPARVLVIHGFTCHRFWLRPICRRLRQKGYAVENYGYKSYFRPIALHAQALHTHLRYHLANAERIDIFAHSMGSLVTRMAIAQGDIKNLGRLVLLAPPSRGTPVARFASPLIGGICRCVPDMSDADTSFANQLPRDAPTDAGVIAAKFDTLVPNRCTHIDNERDHVTLWHTHNSLLFSRKVVDLADCFFRRGRFSF